MSSQPHSLSRAEIVLMHRFDARRASLFIFLRDRILNWQQCARKNNEINQQLIQTYSGLGGAADVNAVSLNT
jgi:hypothetical protein